MHSLESRGCTSVVASIFTYDAAEFDVAADVCRRTRLLRIGLNYPFAYWAELSICKDDCHRPRLLRIGMNYPFANHWRIWIWSSWVDLSQPFNSGPSQLTPLATVFFRRHIRPFNWHTCHRIQDKHILFSLRPSPIDSHSHLMRGSSYIICIQVSRLELLAIVICLSSLAVEFQVLFVPILPS